MYKPFFISRFYVWLCLGFVITLFANRAQASHILGGELAWQCQGDGSYLFELILYRDCNGVDVTIAAETINVWNHPSIATITANFISRSDMSPYCQQVPSSPPPFQCGIGSNTGNGSGAVERVLYRSNPIFLPGNPPAGGWVFTYSNFFRSADLTNIQSPATVGITIIAKMFNTGSNGNCNDSSPRFYEPPYVVTCAGEAYTFNPNVYDSDLDSLVFSFAQPLDQIASSYNPPTDPSNALFVGGFTINSPTPTAAMSPGSSPAALNPSSGTLTFNSIMAGNYAVKLQVSAFRNGSVISENQLEFQVAVENCLVPNNVPTVTPPFNGNTSFETTVMAGDLVSFNLSAIDNELLQNGWAQSTFIYASGAQFALTITDPNSGCANPPCATLNTNVPAVGSPGAGIDFNWQTACTHLIGSTGQAQNNVPYNFVFRVQDDFCQIPAVQYITVVVNVVNSELPSAPELTCVDVLPNGDVNLNWDPSSSAGDGFTAYEIHTVQNGMVGTVVDISTSSFTHFGAGANVGQLSYFIKAVGGCGGLFGSSSDTISTIYLEVNNPGTGFAFLNWTNIPDASNWGAYAYIEMEYPTGTWQVVDSVLIETSQLFYEITICEAFLNFRVVINNPTCNSYSNVAGDDFEDMIPPSIPVIQSVSFDTVTGNLIITWNVSPSTDAFGYIIYNQDGSGFYVDLDTVWGRFNNTYEVIGFNSSTALSYTVAAFDSCFTDQFPPTYQTSGKADIHTTMHLSGQVDVCAEMFNLVWTPYLGWADGVIAYRVFVRLDGGAWFLSQTVPNNATQISVTPMVNYDVVIEAVSVNGFTSFSQMIQINFELPGAPDIHYLATASIIDEVVKIKYYSSYLPGAGKVRLQRYNTIYQEFEDLEERIIAQPFEAFEDLDNQASERSEIYRFMVIDSCNNPTIASNVGKTVFLSALPDHTNLTVLLQWSAYESFTAPIVQYRIFRSENGIWNPQLLAVLPPTTRTYLDELENYGYTSGEFCYFVEAVEGFNIYSFNEVSRSNFVCSLLEPLIYIPNTIIVNGINDVFLPVVSFYDFSNYELTIMDRWGQVVFRSTNPAEGWDGKHINSQNIVEGTFVYILRLLDGQETEITKRGHVNVLVAEK